MTKLHQTLDVKRIKELLFKLPKPLRTLLHIILILPTRSYIRYAPFNTGKLFLYNGLASHLWWLESFVCTKTLYGDTIWVNAGDIVGKYLYYFGIWEPNLTRFILGRLKPGDTFVDIGANVGYFSVLASRIVGSYGKVVAIEALPQIAEILTKNIRENSISNVRIKRVAVWNKRDELSFYFDKEHLSGSTTCKSIHAYHWCLKDRCAVTALPLNEILTYDEIRSVKIIKIDVEGAELEVINGMVDLITLLRKDVEIVTEISIKVLEEQGRPADYFIYWFKNLGFNTYKLENDYSAESYIKREMKSAKRLRSITDNSNDQIDLVFSRVDKNEL